jgi:hypothetical protein
LAIEEEKEKEGLLVSPRQKSIKFSSNNSSVEMYPNHQSARQRNMLVKDNQEEGSEKMGLGDGSLQNHSMPEQNREKLKRFGYG